MKTRIHNLVNRERTKQGIPAVRWSSLMTRLAQSQANYCARIGYCKHSNRLAFAGGENLCGGRGNFPAEIIVATWMHSPEHKEYLLSRDVKQVGTGVARRNGKMFVAWAFSSVDPNEKGIITRIIAAVISWLLGNKGRKYAVS